jgi:bifunctional DNA-binding transcriptional regulator/antitoxin component of YhaV-PrlF toxin-antitoxin module
MSTLDAQANKSEDDEAYKHMIPCGKYEMREGSAETHGGDEVNGTIVVPQSKVKAAGAGPKESVRVRVEANGKTATMERKIHNSGNTLTIPYKKRRELDLEAGDEIEFWIEATHENPTAAGVEMQETLTGQEESSLDRESEETYVVIGSSFTYHLLETDDADETLCGLSLEGEDTRTGNDPGDFLDGCPECKARSAKPMSSEEMVKLLSDKVSGFTESEGKPTEFSPRQLAAIKDKIVEMEETEAKLREFRARVARLEQRIQELEGSG